MFRKLTSIVVLCLLVTGCMADHTSNVSSKSLTKLEKEQPAETFIPKTLHVVAIGDSLTKGVGDETNQGGYIGKLINQMDERKEIKDIVLNNYGIKGHKTSNLQKKLKENQVVNHLKKADLIFVTIGGNDLMNVVKKNIFSLDYGPFREGQKTYENNLKDIINTIRENNTEANIVLIGLYNPFKYMLPELSEIDTIISEWNTASQQIINHDGHSVFVSVEDIFTTTDEILLSDDQFHPNRKGYELIADRVLEELENEQVITAIP
ncbi:SGNH/GDSL hydrolase family protein [Metabacillus malikii]|uniref:Lysophospholipase L1-like esterase n=1 Tax=Metabacillus malikii TaxID=1504265 RepID=A0ABT9ZAL1_9BACI|nr:SGNH/GDSL hydrolase family protein [Metabacillus malikii]MDQ0228876.1 lysophospholipase L1-like esterase [Metabacillus malikii]